MKLSAFLYRFAILILCCHVLFLVMYVCGQQYREDYQAIGVNTLILVCYWYIAKLGRDYTRVDL